MSIKAKISKGYRWRLAGVGLATLAFGGWFWYDGAIGYPKKQKIQLAFQEVQQDHPDTWQSVWNQMATENGWSTEQPGEPMTDMSIYTQYIFAAICIPIGLLFGAAYLNAARRWVAIDDEALTTNAGQRVTWDQVESIDKSRWDTKGIAVVHYRNDAGGGRVVLDDWKFERAPTDQILEKLESHLSDDDAPKAEPAPDSETVSS